MFPCSHLQTVLREFGSQEKRQNHGMEGSLSMNHSKESLPELLQEQEINLY